MYIAPYQVPSTNLYRSYTDRIKMDTRTRYLTYCVYIMSTILGIYSILSRSYDREHGPHSYRIKGTVQVVHANMSFTPQYINASLEEVIQFASLDAFPSLGTLVFAFERVL